MRNLLRHLMDACAVIILIMAGAQPVSAEIVYPGSLTYYMDAKNASSLYIPLEVSGIEKGSVVTKVRSSDKSVLKVDLALRRDMSYSDVYPKKRKAEDVHEAALSIEMTARKTGTATVSFRVDKKKYKSTINVRAYKNPVQSFKFSRLSGVDLKKKFKKSSLCAYEIPKSRMKAGKVTVVPRKGWAINYIEYREISGDLRYKLEGDAMSSATLRLPAWRKGSTFDINIEYVNVKTGGTIWTSCSFF